MGAGGGRKKQRKAIKQTYDLIARPRKSFFFRYPIINQFRLVAFNVGGTEYEDFICNLVAFGKQKPLRYAVVRWSSRNKCSRSTSRG